MKSFQFESVQHCGYCRNSHVFNCFHSEDELHFDEIIKCINLFEIGLKFNHFNSMALNNSTFSTHNKIRKSLLFAAINKLAGIAKNDP